LDVDRGLIIMSISTRFVLKGTLLTIGAFGFVQVLRLGTNVVLARLLAPELFGIMLIVTTLKVGIELITDTGIGQNIIYHENASDPDFYNTAWTLQAIRGVVLWIVAIGVALPIAQFYNYPILVYVLPLSTFSIVLTGFSSISLFLLPKRLLIGKLNTFDIAVSLSSCAAFALFAYLNPTIWSLVFGDLFGSAVKMIGSYFLLSGVTQRFRLYKPFMMKILHFGKWIFLSSIVYFMSMNFDRLYLAKAVPLELLGVYGIARNMSELSGQLVIILGNNVLFPFIAAHSQIPRVDLRKQFAAIRAKLLLLAAIGVSFFITTADLIIELLYDERYQAAGWMMPILIIGSWFSILSSANESTLLGLGKPFYSAISNGVKFTGLLIGLPISVEVYGIFGGVVVVALVNLCRYIPILVGQRREHFSFGVQDLLITAAMFAFTGVWEGLRWVSGFGTSLDSLLVRPFLGMA
jgi:O-antigen/teichoic acid export membrane protein